MSQVAAVAAAAEAIANAVEAVENRRAAMLASDDPEIVLLAYNELARLDELGEAAMEPIRWLKEMATNNQEG